MMIDRVELAAAVVCLLISFYVLANRSIPFYLLAVVGAGFILLMPAWYDAE